MTDDEIASEREPDDQRDFAADFAAFSQVVTALQPLSADGRVRLLRTIATFFKIDLPQLGGRRESQGSTQLQPATTPLAHAPVGSFSEDRTPSPKEFMRDKRPTSDVEKIACLAYYLTHYRDTPHFKTVDLSSLNTEAAQVKFSNASQAADNATKAGLLVPAVKGAKQLSANGELYVQALPDRDAAKESIAHARRRRKPKRNGGGGNVQDSSDTEE